MPKFLVAYCLQPLTRRYGYGVNLKQIFMIAYCNLRGINTFSCWIIIFHDLTRSDRLRELALLYGSGCTLLSWVINGYCAKYVIPMLQIRSYVFRNHPAKEKIMKNALIQLYMGTIERSKQLAKTPLYSVCNWGLVNEILDLDKYQADAIQLEKLEKRKYKMSFDAAGSPNTYAAELRYNLLRHLVGLFFKKFENLEIALSVYRILEDACYNAQEAFDQQLALWQDVYLYFAHQSLTRLLIKTRGWFILGALTTGLLSSHLSTIYDITVTFITVLEESKKYVKGFIASPACIAQVHDEICGQIKAAESYLIDFQRQFESMLQPIHTRRAAMSLLQHMLNFLQKQKNQISDEDLDQYVHLVEQRISQLNRMRIEWQLPDFDQLQIQFPIFNCLSQDQIRRLTERQVDSTFQSGDYIYRKGDVVK